MNLTSRTYLMSLDINNKHYKLHFFMIFVFKFEQFSYLLSLKNSRPCRDLPVTKPICYQLSYPGLDGVPKSALRYKLDNVRFLDLETCSIPVLFSQN